LPDGHSADNKEYTKSSGSSVTWKFRNPNKGPKSVLLTQAIGAFMKPLIYKIPADNKKKYLVTLTFAEQLPEGTGIMDVFVNGDLLEKNLNVMEKVGTFEPYKVKKYTVSPFESSVIVKLVPKKKNAFISAIDISPTENSVTAPTPPSESSAPVAAFKKADDKENAIRINCGGASLAEGGFLADKQKYSENTRSGVQYHYNNPTKLPKSVILTHSMAKNKMPLIYKFHLSDPHLTYDVKLIFAENEISTKGMRIMDVSVNGMVIKKNWDIWAECGAFNSCPLYKKGIRASEGTFEVKVVPTKGSAIISAIKIVPSSPSAVLPVPGNPVHEIPEVPAKPPVMDLIFDTRLEDYPMKVFESGGTVIGSGTNKYLTVFTGFYDFPGVTPVVYQRKFTREPARWTRLKDVPPPTATHYAQATDGSDTICFVGGYLGAHPGASGHEAFCFDRTTNSYRILPDLPEDRAGGGLVTVKKDGKRTLVYAGGVDRLYNSFYKHIDYGTTWTLELDVKGAKWELVEEEMPEPRNHMAAISVCGRHLFVGGQKKIDEHGGNLAVISEYIPHNRTWSKYPPQPLPFPLGHVSASVMAYKCGIIIVGGITNGKNYSDKVLHWDAETDKWSTIGRYPLRIATPVCGIVGNEVMCSTGGADNYWDQEHTYIGAISTE